METTTYENGYNVVTIRCDGCGREIAQPNQGEDGWVHVRVSPLSRDAWAEGDPLVELDLCSTDCFRETLAELDPAEALSDRG